MSTAFYKTSDPAVLAALAAYKTEVDAVSVAGKQFAEHFGGKLLKYNDTQGCRVAGLRFNPFKDDPLWTKPDAQASGRQRPRATLRKGTKEQRQALIALTAEWEDRFPRNEAKLEPFLNSIGTDWGALFFCGLVMFQHGGDIYVSTSTKLAPCMVEILASEYSAAKAAYESVKEVA